MKPVRDRRQAPEKANSLIKDEETELASLLVGKASFVELWPKLRAYGFTTFDMILSVNSTITQTNGPDSLV